MKRLNKYEMALACALIIVAVAILVSAMLSFVAWDMRFFHEWTAGARAMWLLGSIYFVRDFTRWHSRRTF